jgi:flagellin-like hook-associated protein FlgL
MDIAQMSMALSQVQVQQQASVSVMKKAMDRAEGNADFIN